MDVNSDLTTTRRALGVQCPIKYLSFRCRWSSDYQYSVLYTIFCFYLQLVLIGGIGKFPVKFKNSCWQITKLNHDSWGTWFKLSNVNPLRNRRNRLTLKLDGWSNTWCDVLIWGMKGGSLNFSRCPSESLPSEWNLTAFFTLSLCFHQTWTRTNVWFGENLLQVLVSCLDICDKSCLGFLPCIL